MHISKGKLIAVTVLVVLVSLLIGFFIGRKTGHGFGQNRGNMSSYHQNMAPGAGGGNFGNMNGSGMRNGSQGMRNSAYGRGAQNSMQNGTDNSATTAPDVPTSPSAPAAQ